MVWEPRWQRHDTEPCSPPTSTKLGRRTRAGLDALLKEPRTVARLGDIGGRTRGGQERVASLGLVRQVTDSSGERPAGADAFCVSDGFSLEMATGSTL